MQRLPLIVCNDCRYIETIRNVSLSCVQKINIHVVNTIRDIFSGIKKCTFSFCCFFLCLNGTQVCSEGYQAIVLSLTYATFDFPSHQSFPVSEVITPAFKM